MKLISTPPDAVDRAKRYAIILKMAYACVSIIDNNNENAGAIDFTLIIGLVATYHTRHVLHVLLPSFVYFIRSEKALEVAYVTKSNAVGYCDVSVSRAAGNAFADIPLSRFLISNMKLSTIVSSV